MSVKEFLDSIAVEIANGNINENDSVAIVTKVNPPDQGFEWSSLHFVFFGEGKMMLADQKKGAILKHRMSARTN
jgi:hypothetical protein